MFLIPPSSIIKEEVIVEDFEKNEFNGNTSTVEKFKGERSLFLGAKNYISTTTETSFPELFKEEGCKKIRYSFNCYFAKGIKSVHAFIKFIDKDQKTILEAPFYINEDFIQHDQWDYKEFGYEIIDSEVLNKNTVDKITFMVWNVDQKEDIYIDNAKVEFILTDRSFETVK